MSSDLHKHIRIISSKKGVSLKSFYKDAMEWFLLHHLNNDEYLASVANGKVVSIQLDKRYSKMIKILSQQNHVSEARVVYTALKRYLDSVYR